MVLYQFETLIQFQKDGFKRFEDKHSLLQKIFGNWVTIKFIKPLIGTFLSLAPVEHALQLFQFPTASTCVCRTYI